MGSACSTSTVYVPSPAAMDDDHKRITAQLAESAARETLHYKVLCLGAGESGKSTIVKQLQFIHKERIKKEDRFQYIITLHQNALMCMTTLIREAENFGYNWSETERPLCDYLLTYDTRNLLNVECARYILLLWNESLTIKEVWSRRTEYWHLEATEYYFENVSRFLEPNFLPTHDDMIMARKRTTGVVQTEFEYGGIHWTLVDVGGQRSERRKWMNCFDNVKAIIYVVNLAGYNKVLFEDKAVNRMVESLSLFQSTFKDESFRHIPIFVFLNKKDLYESLLHEQNIDICFPDYNGTADIDSTIPFIQDEFTRRLPSHHMAPQFWLLAARVKKDVQFCFAEVKDVLLDLHKKDIEKNRRLLERIALANRQKGLAPTVIPGQEVDTSKLPSSSVSLDIGMITDRRMTVGDALHTRIAARGMHGWSQIEGTAEDDDNNEDMSNSMTDDCTQSDGDDDSNYDSAETESRTPHEEKQTQLTENQIIANSIAT